MHRIAVIAVGSTLALASMPAVGSPLALAAIPSPPRTWEAGMQRTNPQALPTDSAAVLFATARLADYGVADVGAVRRGRVSVAHTRDEQRLGVYFLRDSEGLPVSSAAAWATLPPPVSPPPITAERRAALHRALWVWNTRELIADPEARRAFLDFVIRHGFDRIFLQLPPARGSAPRKGFVPFDPGAVGEIVAELGGVGAGVYALDGDPAYALPANHDGVLRTVARVAAYNASAPPGARFLGVRYDVEPYLLPGFQGPRRGEILDGYVMLAARVSEAAAEAGLRFGMDIPFWLDTPDEETGRLLTARLDGVEAPVLGHLLAHVSDLAVMDYRTRAYGLDGAVAHALGELTAAREEGVGVYVALETVALPDEDLYTFRGAGHSGAELAGPGPWVALSPLPEGGAGVWLVEAGEPGAARARLKEEISARGASAAETFWWPAGRPVRVRADKQSFHNLGAAALETQADRIIRKLGGSPAFLGLAYHHYGSLRALLRP
ncbi:MAG: hypothetical protein ACE5GJ_12140 [Gemmatimonadota bacterium]